MFIVFVFCEVFFVRLLGWIIVREFVFVAFVGGVWCCAFCCVELAFWIGDILCFIVTSFRVLVRLCFVVFEVWGV